MRTRAAVAPLVMVAGLLGITACGTSNAIANLNPTTAAPATDIAASLTASAPSPAATPSPTSAEQAQAERICAMFDTAAPSPGSVSEKGIAQVVTAAVPLDSGQYRSLFDALDAAQQQGFLASVKANGDDILVPAEQAGAFATDLAKVRAECHSIAFGR